ncbi:DUF5591 domain-containing protein [Candidatus Culexarchaeum yellowstonense]|uniref:DUF5591 domain-containing protein n=1 Tax=Candidatus Culexarchaeum yellowstonense TaxID=2928963 RepID=UPI0026EC0199|nr:DUF5591 domain-containing protein [Candidatus Culexarchaeum yellowstonense]
MGLAKYNFNLILSLIVMSKRVVSVILEHGSCGWGKCYFCGWGKRRVECSLDELKGRIFNMLSSKRREGEIDLLKVFSSGSFLDPKQFPDDFVSWFIRLCESFGVKELIVESRPEYITEDRLKLLLSGKVKVTVAIGLELADDNILLNYYCKGLRVDDVVNAVKVLRGHGFGVRLYLLVNGHPYLYSNPEIHKRIFEDSIKLALDLADSVVVINAYPHVGSRLWEDWINGSWRPFDEEEFKSFVGGWGMHPKVELDFNNLNFIPKFPREKQIFLHGVGHDYLVHPYYEVWQDYIVRFYKPPKSKDIALFLPCAYRKPYTRSKTWKAILNAIYSLPIFPRIHLIAVSSPGVIPYEFINYYPFQSYDWPEWLETEEIKREYIEVTKIRVKKYLMKHASNYKIFYAYFRYGAETLTAIIEAFRDLGLSDKLRVVIDEGLAMEIEAEGFKPMVAHPKALNKLREMLSEAASSKG